MERKLVALAIGAFVVAADGTLAVGLLPELGRDLDVSPAAAGQSVSAFAAVYALGGPLFAYLFRRVGVRGVLLGSLALFVVSNLVTSLAPNFSTLLVGRVLAASAAALFMPSASAAAAALSAEERHGRALSIVVSGGAAGIAFGVPAGTWIGVWSSWRVAFLLLAALGVGAGVGVRLLIPALEPPAPTPPRGAWARRSASVLALTCIWAFGSFAFFTYVALVLQRAAGIGGGALALFLLLYGLCGMGGGVAGGWLTDHLGARTTLTASLSLIAVSLAGLGALASRGRADGSAVAASAVLFGLYAIGTWSVSPPQQHRLLRLDGNRRLLLALNASALYAGVALGGAAGGILIGSGAGAGTLCWFATAIEVAALAVLRMACRLEFAMKRWLFASSPSTTREPDVAKRWSRGRLK